jgi:hypothetical protein
LVAFEKKLVRVELAVVDHNTGGKSLTNAWRNSMEMSYVRACKGL